MRKWILILLLILIAAVCYRYVYQDHRNISEEPADFILNAEDLKSVFSSNTVVNEQKYLNKTIELTGVLTNLDTTELTIDDIAFCQLKDTLYKTLKKGSKITIKGRFIGYDDLLQQVKLDQCTIIN